MREVISRILFVALISTIQFAESHLEDAFTKLSSTLESPIIIIDLNKPIPVDYRNFYTHGKFDIITISNSSNFHEKNLRNILAIPYFKGKLFFFSSNEKIFKNVTAIAAENGIHKVGFLQQDGNVTHFYQWNPYDTANCCGKYFNLKKIRFFSTFQEEPPNTHKDCKLRVICIQSYPFVGDPSLQIRPGLMVSLFNTIGSILNISIEYHFDQELQDDFKQNGFISKAINTLVESKADVLIGHLFMEQNENVTFGPMFLHDRLILVAPKPPRTNTYRRIFKVFDYQVWLAYIFVLILMSAFICTYLRMYGRHFSFPNIFLGAFKASMGSGIRVAPRDNPLRIVFIFYCLYAINLNSWYLSKLSGVLTLPPRGLRIPDAFAMYVNNYYCNLSWYVERTSRLSHLLLNEDWIKNMYILNQTEKELLESANYNLTRTVITFLTTGVTYPSGTPLHERIITNSVTKLTLLVTYFLRKQNILNSLLKFWTLEIIEKGLVMKWWKDIILDNTNVTSLREGIDEEEKFVVLSLRHYEEAFLVLFYGYATATIVLLAEFVVINIQRRIYRMNMYLAF